MGNVRLPTRRPASEELDALVNTGPESLAPSVELLSISKYFGENRVLNDVNVAFRAGEIHAVLGANGSGKSTLIKILAGYHSPTAGSVRLHGTELTMPISPKTLHAAGVRFVHQDLGLFDTLSVADNLGLTLGYQGTVAISWRSQYESARRDLDAVGLADLDPRALVSTLGPVQRTLVAMARAIRDLPPGRGVLVLDEPTARLPHDEVDSLLDRCRRLRDAGVALVYVSHRLEEVFAMADTVTVLRDGQLIMTRPLAETNLQELTATITGHSDAQESAVLRTGPEKRRRGEVVMSLRGVTGPRVADVNLDLHAGEVLAITGLIGSGRSELGRIIFGEQARVAGEIIFRGVPHARSSPRRSIKLGIGYVPQDRKQGGFRTFDLADNLSMADLRPYATRGVLSPGRQRAAAVQAIAELGVHPPEPHRLLGELSGGNQQKVILGKWLRLPLRLLVLDEPTYGVDIGARESIMATITDRADRGLAVLLLDSDIELITQHADRVIVMRRGRFVQELVGDEITPERIASASYAMAGPTTEEKRVR
jgi:ribose transport system ATP-binding protein